MVTGRVGVEETAKFVKKYRERIDGVATFQGYLSRVYGLDRSDVRLKTLKKGSRVVAGTILGRIGKTSQRSAPHTLFEIRPAGRGAPRIDPKPILDGWKLLESTAIYRAKGKNPFFGPDAKTPSIGQILLMSKEALAERVVNNPVLLADSIRADHDGTAFAIGDGRNFQTVVVRFGRADAVFFPEELGHERRVHRGTGLGPGQVEFDAVAGG